ncbi:MAG: hypothetical protein IJI35_02875 [Kiritimatiellae bacterium]|nr:hypothetical protein [Kiritimatiellia bacterium]
MSFQLKTPFSSATKADAIWRPVKSEIAFIVCRAVSAAAVMASQSALLSPGVFATFLMEASSTALVDMSAALSSIVSSFCRSDRAPGWETGSFAGCPCGRL